MNLPDGFNPTHFTYTANGYIYKIVLTSGRWVVNRRPENTVDIPPYTQMYTENGNWVYVLVNGGGTHKRFDNLLEIKAFLDESDIK